MKILNKNFEDKRGYILDILYNESFNHATLIHSKKKSIRGNHFHKKTTQITFIISGEVDYYFKLPKSKIKVLSLIKNSFLITKPYEIHAYKFKKNTKMLILSKGLRGGKDYEKDTYRKKII
tara:strand:- start:943 stop:1305 length:363 start_codon:yes stop_codon:yes gene_type:complete